MDLRMKCLAIADLFINEQMIEDGLAVLKEKGFEIDVKMLQHDSLEELQEDNIKLEKQGSEAVDLPEYLMQNLEQYDYIITQFAPVGKKVIDNAPNLKFIGVLRAGIENVNTDYAKEKGISVFNTPGRSETSVSEFTVGLILSEIRNIARADRKLRGRKMEKNYTNGLQKTEITE